MCILSFIPAGIEITDNAAESLWNGGINNPDGHGYAVASPLGMIVGKTLQLDECLSEFVDARNRFPDSPALFHSRWATHGSVRVGNCHPFNVGDSAQTVLAHNGVLPKAAHPANGDDRSDTAIMAAELLPAQWHKLDRHKTRQSLEQFCGRGNKLVILTVDPRYRRDHYIINERAGNWDGLTGIWHSNHDYLWIPGGADSAVSVSSFDSDIEYVDPTACLLCNQRVNDFGICTTCGSCQDCFEYEQDCLCLIPESLRRV